MGPRRETAANAGSVTEEPPLAGRTVLLCTSVADTERGRRNRDGLPVNLRYPLTSGQDHPGAAADIEFRPIASLVDIESLITQLRQYSGHKSKRLNRWSCLHKHAANGDVEDPGKSPQPRIRSKYSPSGGRKARLARSKHPSVPRIRTD